MRAPLRFITCGSVDDGKSTLIGRLLHDSGQIFEDQVAAAMRGDRLDHALLLDGLQAEREQGITIDVSYRYFSTPRRHFIVADCPGHEQYTRNMATGASTADLAVLLVDARKGLLPQTHRHARILALMGVRQVILAVNKLDLLNFDQAVFDRIVAAFPGEFEHVQAIPLSALDGDNLIARSARTPWYEGPTLMAALEAAEVHEPVGPFALPVQAVNRVGTDFRGYAGQVAAGEVRPGDEITILPSGEKAHVDRIVGFERDLDVARAGEAVLLTLVEDRDVGRGDVLAAAGEVADQFEAMVVWLGQAPLVPGRSYHVRLHNHEGAASIGQLKWRLDVESGAQLAAKTLAANDIGAVTVAFDRPAAFAPYAASRVLGAFVLIDRLTAQTVGAGMIRFGLRRSANLAWQALAVDQAARAALMGQTPCCLWLTGLSGAGKSTLANGLEQRLHAAGRHTYVLDGDNVRHGLNRDLGFTAADRVENVRRLAEVARLMVDAGLIVIVAAISPFRAEREWARALFAPGQFLEVHVATPLEACAERDPKGLYAKAQRGELTNFTGLDSPYEPPQAPELVVDAAASAPEACVAAVLALLLE
ncbi:MAG: cysC [Cyanobacteria bacterium RYN_339]|nr:cysC [Cyanobacteria bacterium RYN_339]